MEINFLSNKLPLPAQRRSLTDNSTQTEISSSQKCFKIPNSQNIRANTVPFLANISLKSAKNELKFISKENLVNLFRHLPDDEKDTMTKWLMENRSIYYIAWLSKNSETKLTEKKVTYLIESAYKKFKADESYPEFLSEGKKLNEKLPIQVNPLENIDFKEARINLKTIVGTQKLKKYINQLPSEEERKLMQQWLLHDLSMYTIALYSKQENAVKLTEKTVRKDILSALSELEKNPEIAEVLEKLKVNNPEIKPVSLRTDSNNLAKQNYPIPKSNTKISEYELTSFINKLRRVEKDALIRDIRELSDRKLLPQEKLVLTNKFKDYPDDKISAISGYSVSEVKEFFNSGMLKLMKSIMS
ncbi:MAG: hypothetical protein PHC34_03225 [Candidatus Gastranaerophilales bacterium]|nr:hypothetical protein [Candidatus Gastranaerophilales bacterium]